MTIKRWRIIGAVALGLLALTFAVNVWQAMNGYNLPGSAIVAALNAAAMIVCGPVIYKGVRG